ncbi:MAG: hypothetical protein AAB475_00715 [Patescibacteria group bacterium]
MPVFLNPDHSRSVESAKEAIKAWISNIHINTEIRTAYAEATRKFLVDNPEKTTPYKILVPAVEAVQKKWKKN